MTQAVGMALILALIVVMGATLDDIRRGDRRPRTYVIFLLDLFITLLVITAVFG